MPAPTLTFINMPSIIHQLILSFLPIHTRRVACSSCHVLHALYVSSAPYGVGRVFELSPSQRISGVAQWTNIINQKRENIKLKDDQEKRSYQMMRIMKIEEDNSPELLSLSERVYSALMCCISPASSASSVLSASLVDHLSASPSRYPALPPLQHYNIIQASNTATSEQGNMANIVKLARWHLTQLCDDLVCAHRAELQFDRDRREALVDLSYEQGTPLPWNSNEEAEKIERGVELFEQELRTELDALHGELRVLLESLTFNTCGPMIMIMDRLHQSTPNVPSPLLSKHDYRMGGKYFIIQWPEKQSVRAERARLQFEAAALERQRVEEERELKRRVDAMLARFDTPSNQLAMQHLIAAYRGVELPPPVDEPPSPPSPSSVIYDGTMMDASHPADHGLPSRRAYMLIAFEHYADEKRDEHGRHR